MMKFVHAHRGIVFLAILAVIVFLTGCAKTQGLMTLKRLGKNQDQIEKYLQKQEAFFDKLVTDVKAEKIKVGISKRKFIIAYGDPILGRSHEQSGEELLYRHPTNYFSSDKVYVYFDEAKKLTSFKYKPYKKPAQDSQPK